MPPFSLIRLCDSRYTFRSLFSAPLRGAQRSDNALMRGAPRREESAQQAHQSGEYNSDPAEFRSNPEIEGQLAEGGEVSRAGRYSIHRQRDQAADHTTQNGNEDAKRFDRSGRTGLLLVVLQFSLGLQM